VVRYKGHQNTSRNFIRASFGPGGDTVLGGSEGGRVHVWETLTGQLLERLPGHGGPVFRAVWNDNQAMVASCADDCTVRTWVQK
jgi:COMPASS component SWD3